MKKVKAITPHPVNIYFSSPEMSYSIFFLMLPGNILSLPLREIRAHHPQTHHFGVRTILSWKHLSSWNCLSAWKQSLPTKFSGHKSPPQATVLSPGTAPRPCHTPAHRPSLRLRVHWSFQTVPGSPVRALLLLPLPAKLGAPTPRPTLPWVAEGWAPRGCRRPR